jgi:hypothetical protein
MNSAKSTRISGGQLEHLTRLIAWRDEGTTDRQLAASEVPEEGH